MTAFPDFTQSPAASAELAAIVGEAFLDSGQRDKAEAVLERAIERTPDSVRVQDAIAALNYDPVYSPDGSELAFASNITGDWAIYRQRISDGRSWRVTFGPGPARNPDYRPAP